MGWKAPSEKPLAELAPADSACIRHPPGYQGGYSGHLSFKHLPLSLPTLCPRAFFRAWEAF